MKITHKSRRPKVYKKKYLMFWYMAWLFCLFYSLFILFGSLLSPLFLTHRMWQQAQFGFGRNLGV
ncbi:hypothetical protein LLT5_14160 [Lactococcus cremoris subsp. cremoris TIFN5]|nr:hypothetical protein LLT5_14160 [Lactococcus cremoris subsp. cremoris TIFN5]